MRLIPYKGENRTFGSPIKVDNVKRTIDLATKKAKLMTKQKPRLLSDKNSCYIASELKLCLIDNYQMQQVNGRPIHSQTQGKIERYHITMKNVAKLDNYFAQEELEGALGKFVYRYNNKVYQ